MVGYTNVRKKLENLRVGETAVVVGVPLTEELEKKSEISFDAANAMIRQCRYLPAQIQSYFSGFAMVATVYNDEVFRLPSMTLCCKVKYEDKRAVYYNDILRAFFTSFKRRKEYPIWLPDAAYTARKSRENAEPSLDKRFPYGRPFIAYITYDRECALRTYDSVSEIGIQARESETSKVSRRELDNNCMVGAFFNGKVTYSDGYIIAVLRKALESYSNRKFPDDPVHDPVNGHMQKAQRLLPYEKYKNGR